MQGQAPGDGLEGMIKDTEKSYSGQLLQNGGMVLERMWGDFRAKLVWLKRQ